MFGWIGKRATEQAERPNVADFRFDKVDPVEPSPQFGNTGPCGWGFTLWGSSDGDEFMYRHLLETLAEQYPDARLSLPERSECEDLIEGNLIWRGQHVWVWYETVLTHLWLWSADHAATESLRRAILPAVVKRPVPGQARDDEVGVAG